MDAKPGWKDEELERTDEKADRDAGRLGSARD